MPLFYVFMYFVCIYIYAFVMSFVFTTKEQDTTKSSYYAICSFTYLLAMVTSNKALSWVNYPTQVVGKSCKPIPVMILGVLVGKKSYPLLKYLFILMIYLHLPNIVEILTLDLKIIQFTAY